MVICGCSISVGFLAFQKTFDTVDYVILLEKLEHCALGESLINGLHLILLIEINLCQLIGLIRLWLALFVTCLTILYWILYCF